MFSDEQFSEAAEQVSALLARIELKAGAVLDLGYRIIDGFSLGATAQANYLRFEAADLDHARDLVTSDFLLQLRYTF